MKIAKKHRTIAKTTQDHTVIIENLKEHNTSEISQKVLGATF